MAGTLKKWITARRLGALVLAVLVVAALMPVNTLKVQAAAKKPTISKSATVALNGTKTLKISKNGFAIKSVKVKSSKTKVAQAKAQVECPEKKELHQSPSSI